MLFCSPVDPVLVSLRYGVQDVGASAIWSHAWRERVKTALTGAHTVDARQPLEQVVSEILEYCAGAGYPISVE